MCETQIEESQIQYIPATIGDHNFKVISSMRRAAGTDVIGRPGTTGGGIALLTHKSIQCIHLENFSNNRFTPYIVAGKDEARTSAIHWFEIRIRQATQSFLLGIAYVSPAAQNGTVVVPELITNIERLRRAKPTTPILLVGDFNMQHRHWDPMKPNNNRTISANLFHRAVEDNELALLNNTTIARTFQVTRPNNNDGEGSVLDLAFTTHPSIFHSLSVQCGPCTSDHHSLEITMDTATHAAHVHRTISVAHTAWAVNRRPDHWQSKLPTNSDKLILEPKFQRVITKLSNQRQLSHRAAQRAIQFAYDGWESRVVAAVTKTIGVSKKTTGRHSWSNVPAVRQAAEAQRRSLKDWRLSHKIMKRHSRRNNNAEPSAADINKLNHLQHLYRMARDNFRQTAELARQAERDELTRTIQENPRSPLVWSAVKRARPTQQFRSIGSIRDPAGNMPSSITESLSNLTKKFVQFTLPTRQPNAANQAAGNDFVQSKKHKYGHEPHEADNWKFSSTEIADCARALHVSSPGPDSLKPVIIKHLGDRTFSALSAIYNFSWRYAVLPQQWTESNVTPLIKDEKGDQSDAANYRPISVTNIVIRLFEHLIHAKLREKIDPPDAEPANQILARHQYGFRAARSTHNAIHRLLTSITNEMSKDNKSSSPVPAVFVDLAKAFDRVSHTQLMIALEKHAGITGRAWRWIYAFISSQRRIRCVNNGSGADWHSLLEYGVPQGAVLSPFLFVIFINTAVRTIERHCPLVVMPCFADDVAFTIRTIKEQEDWYKKNKRNRTWAAIADRANGVGKRSLIINNATKIQFQRALDLFSQWCITVGMVVNQDKSKLLVFKRTPKPRRAALPVPLPPPTHWYDALRLDGFVLQQTDNYKYLGLILNQHFSWREHCCKVLEKVRATATRLASLYRYQVAAPHPICAITLVRAIIYPKLLYASQFFTFTKEFKAAFTASIMKPLRAAFDLPQTANILGLLQDTALPSLPAIRAQQLIAYTQKFAAIVPVDPATARSLPAYQTARLEHQHTMGRRTEPVVERWQTLMDRTKFKNLPNFHKQLKHLHNYHDVTRRYQDAITEKSNTWKYDDNTWEPYTKTELHRATRLRTYFQWIKSIGPVTSSPLTEILRSPHPSAAALILYTKSTTALTTLMRLRHGRAFTNDVRARFPDSTGVVFNGYCTDATCRATMSGAIPAPLADSSSHTLLHCPRNTTARLKFIADINKLPHGRHITLLTLTLGIVLGEPPPGLVVNRANEQGLTDWYAVLADFILAVRAAAPVTAQHPKPL